MKRFLFNPNVFHLPKRNYDILKYANYIDYLNGKERGCKCVCHCFAVFDSDQIECINAYLLAHPEHECYIDTIFEDQLVDEEDEDDENNNKNNPIH